VPLDCAIPNKNVTPTSIINRDVGNRAITAVPLNLLKRPPATIAKPIARIPTLRLVLIQEITTTIIRAAIEAKAAIEIFMFWLY
jgi:hypothetical protein